MMRVALLVLVACVAMASANPLHSEAEYRSLFNDWLKTYPDMHALESHSQYETRFNVYKSNMERVLRHNVEADAGVHSFRLGMNQFAAMTNAEYRSSMLGLKRTARTGGVASVAASRPVDVVTDAPAAWDWRTKGAVTPVKNQGQCGSCWAFSATAAMEGAHFNKTGKLVSFSEQLCVDCVLGGADNCNAGGEMHDCYLEIIKLGGEETEESYPYEGTSGNQCRFEESKKVVTGFTGYVNVTMGDEAALQLASSQNVISVGIDASSFWFQLYSSGVFNDKSCKKGYDELDHGVTVVGYGTDSGKDYWIVKNSWGGSWGQEGYIWMTRNGDNQCGIATDATYPIYA